MPLPDWPEFDIPFKLTQGRLTPRQLAEQGLVVSKSYYRIPPTMTFDFLESNSPDFYEISFRVVRLQTDSGNTETLITNLDPDRFPLATLKTLYARRWGIETSFRSLKYAVGLIHLHAKKPDLVLQEIFPVSSSLISRRPLPGLWMHLRAQPNISVMSISPTLSLPAVLSCAAPPLIRSRSSGEDCSRSSGEDCSRFALGAPPQGQKSQVTAFPPAMPPLADLFYIPFLTELPPSAFAASFFG